MADIWFTSDSHFGHANLLTFKADGGGLVRAGFRDVDHMDEVMIERWNAVVKPTDKIYHLGDVAMNKRALERVLPRLMGKKRLILGNHDMEDMSVYRQWFQKIASWRHFTGDGWAIVATHFPLHPSAFLERYEGACLNVHGHLHERVVRNGGRNRRRAVVPDPRYRSVCVEQTNYAPVNYDTLVATAKKLGR
jgi:calcineurin-like phosphoesterase family protein